MKLKYNNTMIANIQELSAYLFKHKLTPNQLYFMVLIAQDDPVSIWKFHTQVRPFSSKEINELIERKFVKVPRQGSDIADFSLREDIAKELRSFEDSSPGLEFWEAYPSFFWIEGGRAPLKAIDKDAFIEDYNKELRGSRSRHDRIMNALKYALRRNEVKVRIDKWLKSEIWLELEKEMMKKPATKEIDDGRL